MPWLSMNRGDRFQTLLGKGVLYYALFFNCSLTGKSVPVHNVVSWLTVKAKYIKFIFHFSFCGESRILRIAGKIKLGSSDVCK